MARDVVRLGVNRPGRQGRRPPRGGSVARHAAQSRVLGLSGVLMLSLYVDARHMAATHQDSLREHPRAGASHEEQRLRLRQRCSCSRNSRAGFENDRRRLARRSLGSRWGAWPVQDSRTNTVARRGSNHGDECKRRPDCRVRGWTSSPGWRAGGRRVHNLAAPFGVATRISAMSARPSWRHSRRLGGDHADRPQRGWTQPARQSVGSTGCVAAALPVPTIYVSHLTPAERATVADRYRGVSIRPRIGTALWPGDRTGFTALASLNRIPSPFHWLG